jgi:hypothetical protein
VVETGMGGVMRGSDVAVVTATVPSLEDAHEMAGRLTQAGFARNSIDIERLGEEEYEVSMHVRASNRARAERAIHNISRGSVIPGVSNATALSVMVGVAALGAGIVAALAARNGMAGSLPFAERDEPDERDEYERRR